MAWRAGEHPTPELLAAYDAGALTPGRAGDPGALHALPGVSRCSSTSRPSRDPGPPNPAAPRRLARRRLAAPARRLARPASGGAVWRDRAPRRRSAPSPRAPPSALSFGSPACAPRSAGRRATDHVPMESWRDPRARRAARSSSGRGGTLRPPPSTPRRPRESVTDSYRLEIGPREGAGVERRRPDAQRRRRLGDRAPRAASCPTVTTDASFRNGAEAIRMIAEHAVSLSYSPSAENDEMRSPGLTPVYMPSHPLRGSLAGGGRSVFGQRPGLRLERWRPAGQTSRTTAADNGLRSPELPREREECSPG